MGISSFASATVRSTLSAVLGGVGGLFQSDGPVHSGSLIIDDDAELPGKTRLLSPGTSVEAVIRMSVGEDAIRTISVKVPDAYGRGRDQDLLLASSADGIPFHHAVLPADRVDSRLYSSLWLYLAGLEPVVFGLRARQISHADVLTDGDRFDFLISSAVSRFRAVGSLVVGPVVDGDRGTTTFAARNTGGGLRALPPALFYRG